ncbi:MAG: LysM peptidoglycan-binding domain-containing protein [Thermoguttaceae bacterium]
MLERLYGPRSSWRESVAETLPTEGAWGPTRPNPPTRTHTIADGDTLPGLAARYLGDPSRWGEIFAANRQLFSDPETLPLGATLTIPPARGSRDSNQAGHQLPLVPVVP